MEIITIDTETKLMAADQVAPDVICVSFANSKGQSELRAHCDPHTLEILTKLFKGDDTLVFHYAAFDLTVIAKTWPSLEPLIWAKLGRDQITDTMIREKLLNLSTFGAIDKMEMENGAVSRLSYSLSDLEKRYLGMDRSDEKEGDDIWRLRYAELEGMKIDDYPEEAYKYAVEDAENTMGVYQAQEVRKIEEQCATTATEFFQTATDFALRKMTVTGIHIDREARDELAAELAEELTPEKMQPLVDAGILRSGLPPMPYKNGALNEDGTPKLKKAKKPSINTKVLHSIIEDVCEANGLKVIMTNDGTEGKKSNVSASESTIIPLALLSPVLKVYQHRQKLQRLAGTELPRLNADKVHPNYSILKETGRTSSYGNAHGSLEPYPSTNIQQVDPRARGCFIPRPGHALISIDYSALELCSVAHQTFGLFKRSVHRDKLLAGYDLHAYLGGQLAYHLDDIFPLYCARIGAEDPDAIYKAFLGLKTGDKVEKAFFKHWRKFAKPVGLGLPGGLGPATLVTFAKGTYGVDMTEAQAAMMKEIWLQTYTEMPQFFKHINNQCEDPMRPDTYKYTTPGGMLRRGAAYCAACNGLSMQSPSAEGAKLAVFNTVKASKIGHLKGINILAFIHDEVIAEAPLDRVDEAALKISEIMDNSMAEVLTDVPIATEAAAMMRWDKRAEPVFDKAGKLIPWEPPLEEK